MKGTIGRPYMFSSSIDGGPEDPAIMDEKVLRKTIDKKRSGDPLFYFSPTVLSCPSPKKPTI